MKKLYVLLVILFVLFSTIQVSAQAASITWPLANGISPNAAVGNIQGTAESIGVGPVPTMSISSLFPYGVNGQQLWVGNTGWIAGPLDLTRFIQFDATPTSGNVFTVTNVSFNYGDETYPTNFNMLSSQVSYSTDNWATAGIQLNSNVLNYLNTAMQSFTATGLNVLVNNSQTFSLRIYPYAVKTGSPMYKTYAIHNSVVISGTTAPQVVNGSICGTKFNDLNGDGIQNNGEPGLQGWTISLTSQGAAGPVTVTTNTGADGNYCFNDVAAGRYTVSETQKSGWTQISPVPGTYTITLTSGQNLVGQNFGNQQIFGSICGMKFNDLNANGVRDPDEPGLSSWTISLTYNNAAGPVTVTTTTDANGNYCFNKLAGGSYAVSETQKSGWTQTFPAAPGTYSIRLSVGQNLIDQNFGNHFCIPTITGSTSGSTCGSGTVALGATASGGTINWYDTLTGGSSLGTGITFTTPVISTSTTYYVDATDVCGTTAVRTAVVATVNALPIVIAPGSVAVGSTITLSPITGGTWTSSNPLVATVTNAGVVTGVSAGTATFTFTNTLTGCSATTSSVTIGSDCVFLCNSDFEISSPHPSQYNWIPQADVPCWHTTGSLGEIEIWKSGFQGFLAYTGIQFAELNAEQVGTFYQTFTAVAGTAVNISFAHMGRYAGLDKMEVQIGPDGGPYQTIGTYYDNNTGWTLYSVSHTFLSSGLYQLRFASIYSNGGGTLNVLDGGNFLDAITIECLKPSDATVNPGGPDQICQSANPSAILLSGATVGGSATTGAWSIVSGGGTLSSTAQTATPSTITYTPAANYSGTVILKLTTNSSPAISATRTITINTLPAAPAAITGSFTTCIGSTTQLTDITTGGTWTSASTGIATINASTGLVTGIAAGTSLITYTTASPVTICTNSVTQTVTVNAVPTISATIPASRCGTGTITLGAAASAGTINWYSALTGGTSLGTGSSFTTPVISTTTTYYVDATSGGCTTAVRTAIVATVNALPIVTAPVSVNVGSTINLSPSTGGTWTSSNPLAATVTNTGVVTGISAGTATFTFTNSITKCSATTTTVTVIGAEGKPCIYLCNSDFEQFLNGVAPSTYIQTSQNNIPCWKTTATDGNIEIWHKNYGSVPAYSGDYFAELNATQVGTLYQTFTVTAPQTVIVSFAHRGRYAGVDKMKVWIGTDPNGTFTDLGTYTDNNSAWKYYTTAPYQITASGTYRLKFESISSNNGSGPSDGGNFLDAINVTCPSSICGNKYNDLNGDGIQNGGEPGISDWEIQLTYNDATGTLVTLTTRTGPDGSYCFNNLAANTYTVTEVQKDGWTQTFPQNPGTHSVILTEGKNVIEQNFGNHQTSTPAPCDLLSASATKVTPGDCIWSLSLNQPAVLSGVSSIQVLTLSPNQMAVGTALVSPYNTWFSSGTLATGLTFTPSTGIVPGGNLTNFLTLNLSYVTSPQTVIVNWLNDLGGAVCSDTLQLNCQPTCVSILAQRVTCVGNKYNLAYLFTNNATYGIHTVDYIVQSPANVTITPASIILSPDVASYSTSALQNILLTGAIPGDQVSITAKFMSPDGCCWCFETLNVTIPTCDTVCDSLIVRAQGTPEDCCYSISLTNNSSLVFSNVEFELLSGGMFGTMSASSAGWGFTNVAPNNLLNLVKLPLSQGIGNGTFNNVLDVCIRQYSSPNQVVEVRWMNHGKVVCRDTLRFECIKVPPVTDDCSQITGGILTCLPNGTFQYDFRVQNNSNINSTGFKINPTTPGLVFSQTDFPNTPILTGTLSPIQSIIVSGIGQGQNVCFQLTIFKTIAGAGTLVYSDCCHSEPICITTPKCDIKLGSICGTKFNDLNANGVRDARGYGEPGLPKWTITLTGSVTMSTTTDENGNYCFHDLPAGTYTVSEVMQPGWEQTLPQSPGTYTITITSGQVITNINFGNHYDPCLLGLKTWSALQTGIDGTVYALAVIGTDVYVAGSFSSIGGLLVNNIAKWDGQNWSALGNGVNDGVHTLAVMGTQLYVGGQFSAASGVSGTKFIAKWNGSAWSPVGSGINGIVISFAVIGTDLYAGGNSGLNYISKWNGSSWSVIGSGMNGSVTALAAIGTNLYAGGDFTTAGGNVVGHVARWNGTAWSKPGNGINTDVFALATIGSNLYASGYFNDAGGVTAKHIAKWDGANWSALGSGVDNYVEAFAVNGTDLYAAGSFTNAGGVNANRVAKWDGASWTPLGNGINSIYVKALAISDKTLYAGGWFTDAIGEMNTQNIAKYACLDDPLQPGSICGMKFNDLNGNGRKDDGEVGLANWTIILSGLVEKKLTTDKEGNYCFTEVVPGKYEISEVNQKGWLQTAPYPETYTIIVEPGQRLTGINFGNRVDETVLVGSICGMKFNDLNGNGKLDEGERGIPNWTIVLSGTADMKLQTDEKGYFCFTNLKPGKYEVSEVNQDNWLQTSPYPGSYTFILESGQSLENINFGNRVDQTAKVGSICGMKFNDLNGNGRKDEGESGLPNWTIILSGEAQMEATTDRYGNFCFTNLRPGKYEVSELNQNGWKQTSPYSLSYTLILESGQNLTFINFGNKAEKDVKLGSICGMKFNDLNGNGIMDKDESGLPNWTILLSGETDRRETTTDRYGNFCFTDLVPGKYELSEVNQNGWLQTAPSTRSFTWMLESGQNLTAFNFGNRADKEAKVGSICGMKFNDLNGNGIMDRDEPGLPNWTIILSGTSHRETTTDKYGNYCFNDLVPGKYELSELNQLRWKQTAPSTGTYSLELSSGQHIGDRNFGNRSVLTLLSPAEGETLQEGKSILFNWLPPVPVPGSYQIKIVEITGDQSPEEAISMNTVLFEAAEILTTSFTYPVSAMKLRTGRKYAWQIATNGPVDNRSKASSFALRSADEPIRISVMLQSPPFNQLRAEELWKAVIENTSSGTLNIQLFGTLELAGEGIVAARESLPVNLAPGKKGINFENFQSEIDQSIFDRWGNLIFGDGDYTMCLQVKDELGNELGRGCLQQSVELTTFVIGDLLQQGFKLAQNHPNPFSTTTTIGYEIPKAAIVQIRIYDMLGKQISLLVNEQKSAGKHEIVVDRKGLVSGIYYYSITSGGLSQTRKMILITF
ncbi:MAG TPA: SdrD B-like domain-containing protein [Prolixibacteraceae bacterium]